MKTKYRNVAFLAELLINVLVFSISCAVLAGLFGKAWQIARDTRAQSFAGAEVEALVETMKLRGPEGLEYAQQEDGGAFLCRYDRDWQPLALPYQDRLAVAYTVRLQITPESTGAGTLSHITAVVLAGEGGAASSEIYRLETATYQPAGGNP